MNSSVNVILAQRSELAERHYITRADPRNAYWFNFYAGEFFSNPYFVERPVTQPPPEAILNDYAIENRRIEINARLKQSVFRQRVLANFGGRCCLSGVTELELLTASHVV